MKAIKPPKHTQRRIVWHSDRQGQAIMLVGYCPDTLPYFLGLANELKRTFPDADPEEMICAKVSKSSTIQGFTVLLCPVNGPKRKVRGWEEYGSIDFNY